jgi:hypothetical protein
MRYIDSCQECQIGRSSEATTTSTTQSTVRLSSETFGWPVALFAVLIIVLQIGLQTRLLEHDDNFQQGCYTFVLFSLLMLVILLVCASALFVALVIYNLVSDHKGVCDPGIRMSKSWSALETHLSAFERRLNNIKCYGVVLYPVVQLRVGIIVLRNTVIYFRQAVLRPPSYGEGLTRGCRN